jgi:hypothetical protein
MVEWCPLRGTYCVPLPPRLGVASPAAYHRSHPKTGGMIMAGNKVSGGMAGGIWFAGWLFTLGFAQLVWWKAILGLVVWPYYLAVFLR